MNFIDLEIAFDRVPRESMLQILELKRYKLNQIIKNKKKQEEMGPIRTLIVKFVILTFSYSIHVNFTLHYFWYQGEIYNDIPFNVFKFFFIFQEGSFWNLEENVNLKKLGTFYMMWL